MGEDYKAKIEVLLNNEGHVDMCLNGDTTTLQNLAISVLAQTIALGMDSWEAAKKRLTDITVALPLALEEARKWTMQPPTRARLLMPPRTLCRKRKGERPWTRHS